MQKLFEEFRQIIDRNTRFILTTHINPDPDAIGSELALARFLAGRGKIVAILNHSATPANCTSLDTKNIIEQFEPVRHANMVLNADAIVVLDANQPERLQNLQPYVANSKATKVCIDHHPEKRPFADLYMVDEDSVATGEILYRLLLTLDPNGLSEDVAIPLYAAIMTDSGSFRFPKTDGDLHRIIADLIERGADPSSIYRSLYEEGSAKRVKLLGLVLSTLQLAHNGRVAFMNVTREMFRQTETSEEDVENFINYTLSISGVQIGLLFTELAEGIKISFRSRGDIAVNRLAQDFGGNGHTNAAGARIAGEGLEAISDQVIARSLEYLV